MCFLLLKSSLNRPFGLEFSAKCSLCSFDAAKIFGVNFLFSFYRSAQNDIALFNLVVFPLQLLNIYPHCPLCTCEW